MPYIKPELRKQYSEVLDKLPYMKSKGELEYCIFYLMLKYMNDCNVSNYSNLHDTTYAAQHCADEFRRRFLDKREDKAREENGDM